MSQCSKGASRRKLASFWKALGDSISPRTRAIRERKVAIVVEGYFDVLTPAGVGVSGCVATCGTALTTQQAQMLRRFASKVIINFDPDSAGQNAAERSSELLVEAGVLA